MRQLLDYAQDYFHDYARYTAAPNTRKHAPYISRVLLKDDAESVTQLLNDKMPSWSDDERWLKRNGYTHTKPQLDVCL
ncbi:hypothetical protein [Paenibacillus sp. 1P07SE]|uniref:hypothetical protein n=1 Tax=Paenibacillus sp. 1P07SE TaxID=3132209 RepID=UPI0039A53513